MEIIGLTGFAGSGKSTVAQYIRDSYGYSNISFADSLKDCLSIIFGWDRDLLEGITPRSREWREEVDHWWSKRLGIDNFTPRFAMTNFGTDVMRRHFHDGVWTLNTERKLASEDKTVLVDCRFPNELAMVRRLGGRIFRVSRGENPEWIESGIKAAHGDKEHIMVMTRVLKIHESEWLWLAEKPDAIIDNGSDLSTLYAQIDQFI